MLINIEVFYKLIHHFGCAKRGMPKLLKISFIKCISLQYLKKKMGNEVDFLPVKKHKTFSNLIVLFSVCIARHAQSAQNNKFPISLQYLK